MGFITRVIDYSDLNYYKLIIKDMDARRTYHTEQQEPWQQKKGL